MEPAAADVTGTLGCAGAADAAGAPGAGGWEDGGGGGKIPRTISAPARTTGLKTANREVSMVNKLHTTRLVFFTCNEHAGRIVNNVAINDKTGIS